MTDDTITYIRQAKWTPQMKRHSPSPNHEVPFPLYSEWFPSLDEAGDIQFPTKHTILFLAADTTNYSKAILCKLAENMIRKGVVYVCCWGTDCERMHDCFDEACFNLEKKTGKENVVMTTWHTDEPLLDTIWGAIFASWPDDNAWNSCATVIMGVGNSLSSKTLIDICEDIDGLVKKVL